MHQPPDYVIDKTNKSKAARNQLKEGCEKPSGPNLHKICTCFQSLVEKTAQKTILASAENETKAT